MSDKQILRMLEEDGRLTAAQVAERLGKPEKDVKARIAELEKKAIIRRYKALIDWEKAGVEDVFAFIEVKVTPSRGRGFDAVAERLLRFPEVHSLYLMSGAYDLHVVIRGKTMKEVAYFVAEKLAPLEDVQSTATHFVLRKFKVDGDPLGLKEEAKRLAVSA